MQPVSVLVVGAGNRGSAYASQRIFSKAMSDYTEAIRLKPTYVHAYTSRGLVYDTWYEYDKAIADYSEAIRLKPDHGLAYYLRAISYVGKGEQAKAEADAAKAEQLGFSPDEYVAPLEGFRR